MPLSTARLMTRRNVVLLAVVVMIFTGLVIVAVARESQHRRLVASMIASQRTVTPRPPLTRAEEAYIQALWPIHGAVERSAARMSLGQIFYVIKDMKQSELKVRVDEATTTYQRAEVQLRELTPPPSLQRAHDDYGAAVRLFQRSAAEVSKIFHDGSEEHLRVAYPLAQEASDKIREIGGRFWPGEFPPN
jgi:hypothetical protein